MRWVWIGLAIVSTVGYLWMNPLVVVVWLQDEEGEDRVEPEEGEQAENLEEDEEVNIDDVLMEAEDSGAGEPQGT